MSDFQLASILVDTEANIRGTDGLYKMQKAYATDQNNAELFWDDVAEEWLWATHFQSVFNTRTNNTAPADTADNVLETYVLPKLGSADTLRVSAFFTVTTDADSTIKVKLGAIGGCPMASP